MNRVFLAAWSQFVCGTGIALVLGATFVLSAMPETVLASGGGGCSGSCGFDANGKCQNNGCSGTNCYCISPCSCDQVV